MAEVQESGPLALTEKFTYERWRDHFGSEAGIRGDTNGTAFGLTLPPSGDVAEVGSTTIDSVAKVGGFPVKIPAGSTQSVTIPASDGGGTNGRTDLIVERFDSATYTTAPGPSRLAVITGTEGSTAVPSHDPKVELPLWAVRRREGESLNQAIPTDLRVWIGETLRVAADAPMPTSAPLGTRATRDGTTYRRDMVSSSPQWVAEAWPVVVVTGVSAIGNSSGYTRGSGSRIEREGPYRRLHGEATKAGATLNANSMGGLGDFVVATLAANSDRPSVEVNCAAHVRDDNGATYQAGVTITPSGNVYINSTNPNVQVRDIRWDAAWRTA